MDVTLAVSVFVTLFVIMDPVGTVPIFLSLTGNLPTPRRRHAAWQAVAVSFAVIVTFAFFGQRILNYLHISMPALQGAGGLLLLLVALELLTGRGRDHDANSDTNVTLVPLGTPLMAGPGAIVATMVFARGVVDWKTFGAVALGIVGVHFAVWLAMRFSILILRVLRESGVLLLTRISGMLLSAIAVQMVADSIRAFVATTA